MLGEADLPDRPMASFGAGKEFGASMGQVGVILSQAPRDEQVGNALHSLSGYAQAPADLDNTSRLTNYPAWYLPPGGGKATLLGAER